MERFSESVDNDDWSSQLLTAISGRGEFRYFKDTIHRLGIQKDWYAFRDEAFREIARDFLVAHEDSVRGGRGRRFGVRRAGTPSGSWDNLRVSH